jgi:hypothetical protein
MMDKTALGSRSSCGAPAWPNQVKGAALPNGSSRKNLRHRSHSLDITIGTCRQPDPAKLARAHHFRVNRILARDPANNQYP